MPAADLHVPARVVALDIGNVCLRLQPDVCARFLGFPDYRAMEARCPELLQLGYLLETGRLAQDEFLRRCHRILPQFPETAVLEAMCLLAGSEIPGMAGFVDEIVAAGFRPVFMSDISPHVYDYVRRSLSFFPRVQGAVLSYEVGERKPQAPMYLAMEQGYCGGRAPLLYADDREENVVAARTRGWHAYHVGTVEGLRVAFAAARAEYVW